MRPKLVGTAAITSMRPPSGPWETQPPPDRGVETSRVRSQHRALPQGGRYCVRGARQPPSRGERPQRLPRRRRRHRGQHGNDDAGRARGARPHQRPDDRRHRPRRAGRRRGPRGAARRARQQWRDPLADRARRRRGARVAAGRADRPDPRLRSLRARGRRRLRVRPRARRGDHALRRPRDGPPRCAGPRPHGAAAARRGRGPRGSGPAARRGARTGARGGGTSRAARGPAARGGARAGRGGPEQLAVRREAGVGDAGAYGLTVIVAGVIAALRGDEAAPELEHHTAPARALHLPQHEDSRYRYCTNFVVTGEGLESQAVVPLLEEIGDSVLVVGDAKTLKVHVHTDEPDMAVGIFIAQRGEVSRLDVADMREQVAERTARLAGSEPAAPVTTCGAVVVASGTGIVDMYRGLGAHVVDGGATLNPSTYDILAGIHAVPAAEAIVLPNSPNVILAAERAAELSEKPARVVPTRAQQAGLAALLAFDPGVGAEDNAAAVSKAAEGLLTGGVAPAARDDASGRFTAGDAVGYAGEDLVAWGGPEKVLRRVLEDVCDGCEVVTCVAGADAPLGAGQIEALVPEGVELDHHEGGQPSWWWLLAAE